MQVMWGLSSDAGGRRAVNEDAALVHHPVYLVADGMGGHTAGRMAAETLTEGFTELADSTSDITPTDVESTLDQIATRISDNLVATSQDTDSEPPIAGATAAGIILTTIDGANLWLGFNVGDSRIYRMNDGNLTQISTDHTLVQEMVDEGRISADDARRHPRRNVVTRAVGTNPDHRADFWLLRAGEGDKFLLCTDGVSAELEHDVMTDIIASSNHPNEAARTLVSRAMFGGAADNVTAVVVYCTNANAEAASDALTDTQDDLDQTLPPARTGALMGGN